MNPFVLLAMFGCGGAPPEGPVSPGLSTVDRLVRASMALRGLRPSADEVRAVQDDPATLLPIVEGYVLTPEFGDVVMDMHAEQLLLRADSLKQLNMPRAGVMSEFPLGVSRLAEGEAALELVRHVVESDLPYTEVVTADYTFTDASMAAAFGLSFDPEGARWQRSTYTDGRPTAGLLSENAVWRRHVSNGNNFHRGRANFIAHTFLCDNIEDRDVIVDGGVAISDPAEVADAVQTREACVACHQTLDPMAAFLWGFKPVVGHKSLVWAREAHCGTDPDFLWTGHPGDYCYPLQMYTPQTEQDWDEWGLRPPGYYGTPAGYLDDLGQLIADDPRFATCTVRRFYGWMTQTEPDEVPDELVAELAAGFVDAGYSGRSLALSIVTHEQFSRLDRVLNTRPEQFSRAVESLTGFRWRAAVDDGECGTCWGPIDLGATDLFGYRTMAGGVDGWSVTHATHTSTPTRWLVLTVWAQQAAGHVVETDFDLPVHQRRLLTGVEEVDTDETAVRRQLATLHAAITAETVGARAPEVDATWDLFAAALADGHSTRHAWKTVITALLLDPRFLFH